MKFKKLLIPSALFLLSGVTHAVAPRAQLEGIKAEMNKMLTQEEGIDSKKVQELFDQGVDIVNSLSDSSSLALSEAIQLSAELGTLRDQILKKEKEQKQLALAKKEKVVRDFIAVQNKFKNAIKLIEDMIEVTQLLKTSEKAEKLRDEARDLIVQAEKANLAQERLMRLKTALRKLTERFNKKMLRPRAKVLAKLTFGAAKDETGLINAWKVTREWLEKQTKNKELREDVFEEIFVPAFLERHKALPETPWAEKEIKPSRKKLVPSGLLKD